MKTPVELKYSKTHEWVRFISDTEAEVGLTDYAQNALGDLVFVNLPEVDAEAVKEETICDVESVKAVSDVYAPVNGTVSEVNRSADGTYFIKISHSDSFTGVIGGLDYVYYAEGDSVKANVPVGYSNGESEVQVTMYSQGELLNCFYVTEENNLAWTSQN
jgi:glycine cleavage system H protein